MSGYNCNWQRMRAVLTHECINKCTEKKVKSVNDLNVIEDFQKQCKSRNETKIPFKSLIASFSNRILLQTSMLLKIIY